MPKIKVSVNSSLFFIIHSTPHRLSAMNSNHKLLKATAPPPKSILMMKSTALTLCLVHLMYISFARGFIILPSTTIPSSLQQHHHHRHAVLSATRQQDILASRSSTTRSTIRPTAPSRSLSTINNNNNNNNQYTQFFKENVLVEIQRTSPNSRRISGEMIMNIPIDTIWSILTDYDNLSVHVPNLVESRVISNTSNSNPRLHTTSNNSPRVYQRGAQRIFGFEFGADVTLDMVEHVYTLPSSSSSPSSAAARGGRGATVEEGTVKQCVIDFKCVDSQFFSEFDGSWIVEEYKDDDSSDHHHGTPITMVRYVVDVRPKGPVPVAALEWRIKEDVPVNILAVSKAATAVIMAREQREEDQQQKKKRQRFLANVVPRSASSTRPQQATAAAPLSSSPRQQRQSSPSRQLQPIQRLTNQAANSLKRTAKSVLPSPVYSTAKQAVNIINTNLPRRPLPRRSRQRNDNDDVPTMSLQSGRDITGSDYDSSNSGGDSNSKDMDVDWYDDETMAMYL